MTRYSRRQAKNVFEAVGECVVTFAMVEQALDLAISYVHDDYGGSKLGIEPPRTALHKKLKYLRKALDSNCELPMASTVVTLLERIEVAAERRNEIVHSVLNIVAESDTGLHPMFKFNHRGTFEDRALSLDALRAFNLQIFHIAKVAGSYAEVLSTGLRPPYDKEELFKLPPSA